MKELLPLLWIVLQILSSLFITGYGIFLILTGSLIGGALILILGELIIISRKMED